MTKTEHYQLNQWDAADQVKRTDFNEDNAKIEEALHRTASQLEPISYNLYYLALQQYYDGKKHLPKAAMLLDGFLNGDQVASQEIGLELDTEEGVLRLAALGEADSTTGTPGSLTKEQSTVNANISWSPKGSGHLTGLTLYFTGVLYAEIAEEGVSTPLDTATLTGAGQAGQFYPLEADVYAGRTYYIRLTNPEGPVLFYYGEKLRCLHLLAGQHPPRHSFACHTGCYDRHPGTAGDGRPQQGSWPGCGIRAGAWLWL